MKSLTFLVILIASFFIVKAQSVDTILVHSASMNKDIKSLVILPAGYERGANYPVLYLLHGHGGDHKDWIGIKPQLPEIASRNDMIMVCPDGASSWYWDSPVDSTLRYDTFVSSELVKEIDSRYKTKAENTGRAITGFSMGGQGALWLGFRHPEVFGACGSTSRGVDIRPFPDNWNIKDSLGEYSGNPETWESHTIASLLPRVTPGMPVIFDCGTSDFFYPMNERLHQEMLYRNIPHEYIARPGIHNAAYWAISIEPQILFFSNYFKGNPVYPK